MVWVGGALVMNSGSRDGESAVEDNWGEGMSLLVVGAVVVVPSSR